MLLQFYYNRLNNSESNNVTPDRDKSIITKIVCEKVQLILNHLSGLIHF